MLTINAACIAPGKIQKGPAPTDLFDVPRFASEYLGLRGINLPAVLLRGATNSAITKLRDCADRANCPILVLVDETPTDYAAGGAKSVERLQAFARIAQALGCSSVAVSPAGIGGREGIEQHGKAIKAAIQGVERLEVNVLMRPVDPALSDPSVFTELIKRVGGFRIGALPSFQYAAASGDLAGALRKVAPYSSAAIEATTKTIQKAGTHKEWNFEHAIDAIRSVGYANTICIDYIGTADPVGPIEKAMSLLTELLVERDEEPDPAVTADAEE